MQRLLGDQISVKTEVHITQRSSSKRLHSINISVVPLGSHLYCFTTVRLNLTLEILFDNENIFQSPNNFAQLMGWREMCSMVWEVLMKMFVDIVPLTVHCYQYYFKFSENIYIYKGLNSPHKCRITPFSQLLKHISPSGQDTFFRFWIVMLA